MPIFVNHYMQLVADHPQILDETADIYAHKGAWWEYFWNDFPLILEIGTGMWNFFGQLVASHPEHNCIGMELRFKRLYTTAKKALKSWHTHFAVLKEYAQNIPQIFWPKEVRDCYIFFPDPWEKPSEMRHRLMQAPFLQDLYTILQDTGKVYFKTDHREYFESTLQILEAQWLWDISFVSYDYAEEEVFRREHITEFEGIYRGKNMKIYYLELQKRSQ